MPRGVENFYSDFSKLKDFIILGRMNGIVRFSAWTIYYCGSCFFCQINMTRNKIGMEMGFKNIFNFCMFSIGLIHISLSFS
jgi:hypothetical protein